MNSDKPHISWPIFVYDRTSEKRFPFKCKWYVFSYERATVEEAREVIELCCKENDFPPPLTAPKIGDVQVTFSIGGSNYTNKQIHKYRHLFNYISDYETSDYHKENQIDSFYSVNLPHDSYYEDENEKPILMMQIMDEECDRKKGRPGLAIVMDMPETILRLDPANPIREELWKESDSRIFHLFFQQFKLIRQSRWIRSPCQVSPTSKNECHARLPIKEDCMAIILPFSGCSSLRP